jgi:hypothetical protein
MRPHPAQERRAHPRVPIRFGAEVHHTGGAIPAATRDMSPGGCLLESERPIPELAEVGIALYITCDGIREDLPPLRVSGAIRWTAEAEDDHGDPVFLSGVQFSGLTADQSRWLAGVIAAYGLGE